MKIRHFEPYIAPNPQENEPSTIEKVYKNYLRAKKVAWEHEKTINEAVEVSYFAVLKGIKRMYQSLPESERIAIEIDKRKDFTDSIGMYSFATKHCYFYLGCTGTNLCFVTYQFSECEFGIKIYDLMKRFIHPQAMKPRNIKRSLAEFFNKALEIQPKQFIVKL